MKETLFKIEIYKKIFEDEEFGKIQDEIGSKIETIGSEATHDSWGGGDRIDSTFQKNSNEEPNDLETYGLIHTKQKIDECVLELTKDMPVGELKLKDSWFNFYGRGGFQYAHHHMPATISGVYYFATSGEDGDISFINPCKFNEYEITIRPRPGLLILFPSYLEHKVLPNMTNDVRISLSFNYR